MNRTFVYFTGGLAVVDRLVIVMTRIYSVSYLIPIVKEGARRWMDGNYLQIICCLFCGGLAVG